MQSQIQVLTRSNNHREITLPFVVGLLVVLAVMCFPPLAHADLSVQRPAQAILQIISAGFLVLGAIGIVFCSIAGMFGFAQWTKLLNIIGWIVVGAGGLSLATYLGSLAV